MSSRVREITILLLVSIFYSQGHQGFVGPLEHKGDRVSTTNVGMLYNLHYYNNLNKQS